MSQPVEDLPAYATASAADTADWRGWRELRESVDGWLCGSEGTRYQAVIDRLTGNWLELVAGQPGWDTPSMDMLGDLADEFGLLMQPDGTPFGVDDNALLAFADDPRTPPGLARRARDWRTSVRYGLWRVDTGPGRQTAGTALPCTDILSGRMRTVFFPARVRNRLVRWAVWYGAVVPDGGRWHATGLGARLSPAEGDAAAEFILAGAAAATLGGPGEPAADLAGKTIRKPMRFGTAEPHGVAVDHEPPFPEDIAVTVSRMAGASIARVLGETYRYRAIPPAPRNGSDEPACLIAARLSVTSPARLRAALAKRNDFAVSRDNPSVLGWLESARPGHRPGLAGGGRTALGTLRFGGPGAVLVQVNSIARFGYLLALLGKIDPGLTISHEKHVDPVLHTAWPAETHTERSASAEGWEKFWADAPLAVLGHASPRQAARSGRLPELLTLLRQFEYQAALLAFEHKSGLDTRAIRADLGISRLDLCRDQGNQFGEGRDLADLADLAVGGGQAGAVQPDAGHAGRGGAPRVRVVPVADEEAAFGGHSQQVSGVAEDPRVRLGDADVGGRDDRVEGVRKAERLDLVALLDTVPVGDDAQLHGLRKGGQAGRDIRVRRPARSVAGAVDGEPFEFGAGRDIGAGRGRPGADPGRPMLVEGQLARQVAGVVLLARHDPGLPGLGGVDAGAALQEPGQALGPRRLPVEQGVVEVEQDSVKREAHISHLAILNTSSLTPINRYTAVCRGAAAAGYVRLIPDLDVPDRSLSAQ